MTKQTKHKAPAVAVRVPQSRAEAAETLRLIGEVSRRRLRIEADMNDEIGAVKERYDAQAAPLGAQVAGLQVALQTWCEANREAICAKGTKTADLGTGKVNWRALPPKVSIKGGAEAVVAALKSVGLQRFIRTKEEPNKEAMQAEPEVARAVPGVTIGSAGEEFIAEPFEAALAEQVAA